LRGGTVVEEQGDVVAVRADQGRPITAFAGAGLGEFDGEITFHTRLIIEAELLGVVGNAAISEPNEWGETRGEFASPAREFFPGDDELAGEAVEGGLVEGALFE